MKQKSAAFVVNDLRMLGGKIRSGHFVGTAIPAGNSCYGFRFMNGDIGFEIGWRNSFRTLPHSYLPIDQYSTCDVTFNCRMSKMEPQRKANATKLLGSRGFLFDSC